MATADINTADNLHRDAFIASLPRGVVTRRYRPDGDSLRAGQYVDHQTQQMWLMWATAISFMRIAQKPQGLQPTPRFDDNAFYKLGEPMHVDIIAGHILNGAAKMHWCSVEQTWVEV